MSAHRAHLLLVCLIALAGAGLMVAWALRGPEPPAWKRSDRLRSTPGPASDTRSVETPSSALRALDERTEEPLLLGQAPAGASIRVTSSATGRPLGGARIRFVARSPASRALGVLLQGDVLPGGTRTGDDGRADLEAPSGGYGSITEVVVTSAGHLPALTAWVPGRSGYEYEYEVALEPAVTIEGMVADEHEKPVPGVNVSARHVDTPRLEGGLVETPADANHAAAPTDDAGRFRLGGLRADELYHLDVAGGEWCVTRALRGLLNWEGQPFPGGEDAVRLVVAPARLVHVRFVEDPGGRPLAVLPHEITVGGEMLPETLEWVGRPGFDRHAPFELDGRLFTQGLQSTDPSCFLGVVPVPLHVGKQAFAMLWMEVDGHHFVGSRVRLLPFDADLGEPEEVRVRMDDEVLARHGRVVVVEEGRRTAGWGAPPRLLLIDRVIHGRGRSGGLVLAGHGGKDGCWSFDVVPAGRYVGRYVFDEGRGLAPVEFEVVAGKRVEVPVSQAGSGKIIVDLRDEQGTQKFDFRLHLRREDDDPFAAYAVPRALTRPRLRAEGRLLGPLTLCIPAGTYRVGSITHLFESRVVVEAGRTTTLRPTTALQLEGSR